MNSLQKYETRMQKAIPQRESRLCLEILIYSIDKFSVCCNISNVSINTQWLESFDIKTTISIKRYNLYVGR